MTRKQKFAALFGSLVIAFFVPFRARSFSETDLENLVLPQPEAVIVANMQPLPTPTPAPEAENLFAVLLEKPLSFPSPTPQIAGVSTPDNSTRQTKKSFVTIAIIGDSMVDTMGTGMPYLETVLNAIYPATDFFLLNYGIGSTNIDSGITRLSTPLNYQNRNYPSLLEADVDAVIIESFAYNPLPLSEANLAHHQAQLENMIRQVQAATPAQVLLLATIAPHHELFGSGPGGVNWEGQAIKEHTQAIHAYLENTLNTANALGLPVIDAFHPSQDNQGNGQLSLISSHDHIHPSAAGQNFIAQHIAQKLVSLKTLE